MRTRRKPPPRRSRNARVALAVCVLLTARFALFGGNVELTVEGAEPHDTLVIMVFDSAAGFSGFRGPLRTVTVQAGAPAQRWMLRELPPGDYAVLVYLDENRSGALDRNFIGIPNEPIGLSNEYRPKGPPTYDRARFRVAPDATTRQTIRLRRPLGRRGRFGVGAGLISRSNPYHGADDNLVQFIPALTYVGERVQILGPQVSIGVLGSGRIRLALQAHYRAGVYEEDDSPALEGMGDRADTVLAGPMVQCEFPARISLSFSYRQDLLNRIGGGSARMAIARAFPWKNATFTPSIGLNWNDADLSDHDFGVPPDRARPERPAYAPGASLSAGTALGLFIEVTPHVLFFVNSGVEFFDDDVEASPIVDKRYVVTAVSALTYVF